tara:strand:+ start:315 stop:968 length:654 start_codon:yes stop_codon:yes gene_type:complete
MRLGLIKKKERYGLTLRGWLVAGLMGVVFLAIAKSVLYPFLALSSPVRGSIMVVEGWLPDYALKVAVADFRMGDYELLITTGGPLGKGAYLAEYQNYADLMAATLTAKGFNKSKIVSIPAPTVRKDRTYATAVKVRQWLSKNKPSVSAIDVYSLGPHARRTRLLFDAAMGRDIRVGIISVASKDYEADGWWRSSDGVRTVLSETIAYIYAKFFFPPH